VRKKNPNDVVAAFQAEVGAVVSDWSAMRTAIGASTGALAKRATVDAFTRVAVAFETFRSDWHIAAINRDSSTLQSKLTSYVHDQLKSSRYPSLASRVRVSLPAHPPLDLIQEILDPQGGNLSIGGFNHWKKRAGTELADPWRSKITGMHTDDRAVLNAVIAVRNALAHESVRSSSSMNSALSSFGAPDSDLRRGTRNVRPSGIAAYLNAVTAQTDTRFQRYSTRLHSLSASLVVV
jgi:hypothetical protein